MFTSGSIAPLILLLITTFEGETSFTVPTNRSLETDPVTNVQENGGPRDCLKALEEEAKYLSLPGIETRFLVSPTAA